MKKVIKDIREKAWSGVWDDGRLGWWLSEFIHPNGTYPNSYIAQNYVSPTTVYKVDVTVKLIRDKKGRPIAKRIKGEAK